VYIDICMYMYISIYVCMYVTNRTSSHITIIMPLYIHTHTYTHVFMREKKNLHCQCRFRVALTFVFPISVFWVPSVKTLLPAFLSPVPIMSPFQPTAAPAATISTALGKKISKVSLFFLFCHPPLSFSPLVKFSAITKSQPSPNSIHRAW